MYTKMQGFTAYNALFTQVIWLDQAFAHCPRFLTAAAIKRLDRVSVPMWLIILSDQLRIIGFVSFYLTNNLILRERILQHIRVKYRITKKILAEYSREIAFLTFFFIYTILHILFYLYMYRFIQDLPEL
jgi:hypothetical protein